MALTNGVPVRPMGSASMSSIGSPRRCGWSISCRRNNASRCQAPRRTSGQRIGERRSPRAGVRGRRVSIPKASRPWTGRLTERTQPRNWESFFSCSGARRGRSPRSMGPSRGRQTNAMGQRGWGASTDPKSDRLLMFRLLFTPGGRGCKSLQPAAPGPVGQSFFCGREIEKKRHPFVRDGQRSSPRTHTRRLGRLHPRLPDFAIR